MSDEQEEEIERKRDVPALDDERDEKSRVSAVVVLQADTKGEVSALSNESVDVCRVEESQPC